MRPPVEITYALVKQKDGRYQVRIKAGNTAPTIVGNFPDKREAQAWLKSDRAPVPDQPTSTKLNRARRRRAKAAEVRTAAESVTSGSASRTLLQLARVAAALVSI